MTWKSNKEEQVSKRKLWLGEEGYLSGIQQNIPMKNQDTPKKSKYRLEKEPT